jgi:FSR family fosmidomycin resistance protein-like MFS transporter
MKYLSNFKFILLFILAINHGLIDFISGFLLTNISLNIDLKEAFFLVMLYNFIAFFLQLPFGIIADKIKLFKSLLILSLILLNTAFIVSSNNLLSVILAGIGSCIFHVIAGKYALKLMPDKAKNVGIFASTGIIGLSLGAYLAFLKTSVFLPIIILSFIVFLILLSIGEKENEVFNIKKDQINNNFNLLTIIFLTLAISINSVVWNIYQTIHYGNFLLLLWIGLSAGIGKITGSFIADKIGWEKYSIIAIPLSLISLLVFKNITSFLIGIALLQSITAIGVSAMYNLMPEKPATASGLTLGFALAISGIPFIFNIITADINSYIIMPSMIIISILYYNIFNKMSIKTYS